MINFSVLERFIVPVRKNNGKTIVTVFFPKWRNRLLTTVSWKGLSRGPPRVDVSPHHTLSWLISFSCKSLPEKLLQTEELSPREDC
jgi:hypothetical protein